MFKVMIVDDMEIMRRQIKRLPVWGETSGFYIIDEAEDGQEALEKLQIQPVDLLITDIRMPRVNGIELLKECNENSLAACTVFLSEHSEFSFAKEAIQYGIFDYIVKPVNQEELRKLLLKAKDYLKVKEEAKIHVKKLEDKLIEKIDIYYPTEQLNSIIKYVLEGDRKAIDVVLIMADNTAIALENDMMKTALVLQRAYNEIWVSVKTSHEWIEKFLDTKPYEEISLVQYDNIDLMKIKTKETIENLISIINKFILYSKKSPLIREICNYVIRNIEGEINIGNISEVLFLSKNYVGDIFKQETGMTVGEYITMIKIERAKQLIIDGVLKNYEIAQKLGYNNVEYFGKLFKKNTGLSPLEFKNTL